MTDAATQGDIKALKAMPWLLILFGVITLGVGIFFIASPHETLATFTVIAGIFLIFDGALAVLGAIFGKGEGRGLLSVVGILSIIAGVILIKHPFSTLVVFVMILGIWLVAAGLVRFVFAFSDSNGRGAQIILALIDLIAGIAILTWPDLSLSTLAVIIGIVLVIRGAAWVYVGVVTRGDIKELEATGYID